MKTAGALLMLCGIIAALLAFAMDTSVSTPGTFIAGSYVGGGSTYNLGLLQHQMMVFQSGLAAFVAGAFLYGSGERWPAVPERQWTDLREGETDEERDERIEREVRREKLGWGIMLAVIVSGILVIAFLASQDEPTSSMNLDENMMNIDENLGAVDNRSAL